jgi:hypothetical protein
MKKKKLTLDKLVLGSLSASEQANILGGDDGSSVKIGPTCIPPTPIVTQKATSILAGCPVTMPPTLKPTSWGITCPAPTQPA